MRPIRAKMEHPTMKNLILLAGDGDFTDMVKFMLNTFKVNVFIFAWAESLNYGISELGKTVYLDEIFEAVSKVEPGATLTNADRLKQDSLFEQCRNRDALFEAAIHKYPDAHDYKNCLRFALQLIS